MRRLAAVTLLAAVGVTACGGTDGEKSGRAAEVAQIESMIRTDLPRSVKRNGGGPILVQRVRCIRADEGAFDCIATVSALDRYTGRMRTQDIPISATCDETNCLWRADE